MESSPSSNAATRSSRLDSTLPFTAADRVTGSSRSSNGPVSTGSGHRTPVSGAWRTVTTTVTGSPTAADAAETVVSTVGSTACRAGAPSWAAVVMAKEAVNAAANPRFVIGTVSPVPGRTA